MTHYEHPFRVALNQKREVLTDLKVKRTYVEISND